MTQDNIQISSFSPIQMMYEGDSAKEWRPFSDIFFKTLTSEAKDVPFSVSVERVDGEIHWKTYLIIGKNTEYIEVSDVHTNFFFHETYAEHPSGAETLAMSMPLKRLMLAYKAYIVNENNPNCVEIIKNALELETEAAKQREKELEAYYNRGISAILNQKSVE